MRSLRRIMPTPSVRVRRLRAMYRALQTNRGRQFLLLIPLVVLLVSSIASAQTTAFTYQGRLTDGGTAASGNYDLQFALFDVSNTQIGSTLTRANVAVVNGVFSVQLDFGAGAFPGANRFLEIGVRNAGGASFTTLSPRQQITSASYGIRTLSAATADNATNATQLGGVTANQYVQTSDSRLSDPRPPTIGSSNYIQNTTSAQAGSNFNISGSGTAGGTLTANIVNAATQYNIGGSRVLSTAGASNLFAGLGAGIANTTGSRNSFFGSFAGLSNTTGNSNAFFGDGSGNSNTTGFGNAFFGRNAGASNTIGVVNAFFGFEAGLRNTTASENAFFGHDADAVNTEGQSNSFFGTLAGSANTFGSSNAFFGRSAGFNNIVGSENTFVGTSAGISNTAESRNTFVGWSADGAPGITNAAAIGYRASVTQSNSLVLGSINGANGATADVNVGIGTTAPGQALT